MKQNIFKFLHWLADEVIEFFQNLSRDLRSIRSLFNYVYLILYVWLVWYGATHYKESINTAIMSTATLVGAIFSGYVFSRSYEKISVMKMENTNANSPESLKVDPNEDGADA